MITRIDEFRKHIGQAGKLNEDANNKKAEADAEVIKSIFNELGSTLLVKFTVEESELEFEEIGHTNMPSLTLYLTNPLGPGPEARVTRLIRDRLQMNDSPRVQSYPQEEDKPGLYPVQVDLF